MVLANKPVLVNRIATLTNILQEQAVELVRMTEKLELVNSIAENIESASKNSFSSLDTAAEDGDKAPTEITEWAAEVGLDNGDEISDEKEASRKAAYE
jgi:hypothetical protein